MIVLNIFLEQIQLCYTTTYCVCVLTVPAEPCVKDFHMPVSFLSLTHTYHLPLCSILYKTLVVTLHNPPQEIWVTAGIKTHKAIFIAYEWQRSSAPPRLMWSDTKLTNGCTYICLHMAVINHAVYALDAHDHFVLFCRVRKSQQGIR